MAEMNASLDDAAGPGPSRRVGPRQPPRQAIPPRRRSPDRTIRTRSRGRAGRVPPPPAHGQVHRRTAAHPAAAAPATPSLARLRGPNGEGAAGPPPGPPAEGAVLPFGRHIGWSLGEVSAGGPGLPRLAQGPPREGAPYRAEIEQLLATVRQGAGQGGAPSPPPAPASRKRRRLLGLGAPAPTWARAGSRSGRR